MKNFTLKQNLDKCLNGLLLGMLFVSPGQACAASISNAWYSPITKGVCICASSYKSWRMVHPRLAKTAEITAVMCGVLWTLDRIINRPVHIPQVPVYFDRDQAVGAAHQPQEKDQKRETAFLFAHGLGGDEEQMDFYSSAELVANTTRSLASSCYAPHFDDQFFGISFRSSLGQDGDIACLAGAYQAWAVDNKGGGHGKNIVLCGVSRGASAIINFMARAQCKQVKALVLESPFDTVNSVVDGILGRLTWIPGLSWLGRRLIIKGVNPAYNPQGVQPIEVVDKIQQDVPILLVCSKEDRLIPCVATVRLYKKLKRQGRQNVYLLICKSGPHANILNHADALRYRNVTHAFYQRYGLWHIPAYAHAGQQDFHDNCQPDAADLI